MDSEQIAHLRALADAATRGPWMQEFYRDGEVLPDGTGSQDDYLTPGSGVFAMTADGEFCSMQMDANSPKDAAFIAAARQAVPDLIEAVERLTAIAIRTGRVNSAYVSRVLRDGLPETWPDPDGDHQ